MTVHLIHGFNVTDGGRGSVGRFRHIIPDTILHSYGWVGAIMLRWRNDEAVREIMPKIKPGDSIIAHSNGCLIAWRLVEAGAPVDSVVCIQPALRRDTRWREGVRVLCCYNRHDWVVSVGRAWGRFWSVANPFRGMHGWGAAGRYGFDNDAENLDTESEEPEALGHSGLFKYPAFDHWGYRNKGWIYERPSKEKRR